MMESLITTLNAKEMPGKPLRKVSWNPNTQGTGSQIPRARECGGCHLGEPLKGSIKGLGRGEKGALALQAFVFSTNPGSQPLWTEKPS